jgi:hypothetical protein
MVAEKPRELEEIWEIIVLWKPSENFLWKKCFPTSILQRIQVREGLKSTTYIFNTMIF